MSPAFMFILGLALGAGIGTIGMWLYLMSKHAGRPVDWTSMTISAVLTAIILGVLLAWGP